ncbi:MAG: hypothetical protein GX303_01215 [Clostridiales bacterium]|nr:hypothetical protein [Clostridiales bacterium]
MNFSLAKKATCLLFVMLLTIPLLFACGERTDNGDSTKQTTSPSSETKDPNAPDLPDLTFDGAVVRFITRGSGDSTYSELWNTVDIYADTINADVINNAVYWRNEYIQDKYDIVIQHNPVANVANVAKNAIQSDSDEFDVIVMPLRYTPSFISDQQLIDLYEVDHLDLSKPYWDQNLTKETSIANKIYYATGDISISDNDATWILMFNKDMIEDFNLESPYDLVHENKWVNDKMYEMMQAVNADLNQDNNMTIDDRFGLATTPDTQFALYYSSGERIIKKDNDDLPYLTVNTERIHTVFENASKIVSDPNLTAITARMGVYPAVIQSIFEKGNALFYGEVMQCVARIRNMEIPFGIIPWPKLSEDQDRYYNYLNYAASVNCIPVTNKDLETTGFLLEAMAAKSVDTLTVAYYDKTLTQRDIRDEESKEMLDIILDSLVYDLGYIYNWGSLSSMISSIMVSGENTFASKYATVERVVKKMMDADIKKILEN